MILHFVNDLTFYFKYGLLQFDDFPVAPTGSDTIVIQGSVIYPSGACSRNYLITTVFIDQTLYFRNHPAT